MKVYSLKMSSYYEGNFGDLEQGPYIDFGLFSTIEKAKEFVEDVELKFFTDYYSGAKPFDVPQELIINEWVLDQGMVVEKLPLTKRADDLVWKERIPYDEL